MVILNSFILFILATSIVVTLFLIVCFIKNLFYFKESYISVENKYSTYDHKKIKKLKCLNTNYNIVRCQKRLITVNNYISLFFILRIIKKKYKTRIHHINYDGFNHLYNHKKMIHIVIGY